MSSSEWAKVEITATTKQTKSAAQVEAEWRAQQYKELNDRIDANRKKLQEASDKLHAGPGIGQLQRNLGWGVTTAKGAQIDTGTRSVLDSTTKSTAPVVTSAEASLRALAGGGFATNFSPLKLGSNPLSEGASKSLAKLVPPNLASAANILKAGKLSDMPGLVTGGLSDISSKAKNLFSGGLGSGGVFNPAGVALETETDPSGAQYVKLAKTVFTSGATVEGVTVDIYDGIVHSPQNKVKSILSDVLGAANKGVLGSLKNQLLKSATGSMNISNIASNLNFDTAKGVLDKYKNTLLSGVALNQKDMLKDVYSAIGYDGKSLAFKGGLKGVGESMLNDVKKSFEGETGILSMYKSAKEVLDGDGDTASNLFKIVGNFTENTRFAQLVGLDQQLGIITNVSKALVDMGAIKFLDDVIEKIDHKDRNKFIEDNLDSGIATGNIEFIKWALKHSSGAKILASYPDAIKMIVSSYSPQVDDTGNIPKQAYLDLVSCLTELSPNWDNVGYRNGLKVLDYNLFASFNRQGQLAVLASGVREHIAALIGAEQYAGDFDTVQHFQVRYPNYPIA